MVALVVVRCVMQDLTLLRRRHRGRRRPSPQMPVRDCLVAFYRTHNPTKLDHDTIETSIANWKGKELELLGCLQEKYEVLGYSGIDRDRPKMEVPAFAKPPCWWVFVQNCKHALQFCCTADADADDEQPESRSSKKPPPTASVVDVDIELAGLLTEDAMDFGDLGDELGNLGVRRETNVFTDDDTDDEQLADSICVEDEEAFLAGVDILLDKSH